MAISTKKTKGTAGKNSEKEDIITKKTSTSSDKKTTASSDKKEMKKSEQKDSKKSDKSKNLQELFEDSLKDILWAEKKLLKALPKMEKNAMSDRLKKAFADHLEETKVHVERLEQCFEDMGQKAKTKKCDAMAGILEEANSIIKETEEGAVRDAGIIAAAQKVEHYEIATYGTLAAFAKVLEQESALDLLLKTLEEEKKCDDSLTKLADTNLNAKAE